MKYCILILIIVCNFISVYSQSKNERIITQTPKNGHTIGKMNGIYCIDDETKPFTGKYIELGYDNELKREANYKSGKLFGVYIEYAKRDSVYIKLKANYVNDKKVGHYIEYFRPNHKKLECYYNQNGELQGAWISFAGFLVQEPDVIGKYINGKEDSTWTYYYDGGRLKSILNFKLGLQNGVAIEYFENGQKKSECNNLNGNKNGKEQKWLENGILIYSAYYKNDNLNGIEYSYYPNGKIEKEGNYLNGIKKGKFIWYNNDGTIKEETTF